MSITSKTMFEFIKDKQKVEHKIALLLKNFQKQYPEIEFKNIGIRKRTGKTMQKYEKYEVTIRVE